MTWQNSVNQNSQSSRVNDIQEYIELVNLDNLSPIDRFYAYSQDILIIGDINFLKEHPNIGGLLLVGIISCTENYFRDILSRIVSICPISQAHSADENISLGSVVWHEPTNAVRGAFEHLSFASSSNIIKTCNRFTDIKLNNYSSILLEFDKICELRHGIVHAGSCVPGKNAIKLQIPSYAGIIKINIGFPELQEAGSICTNLVTSINQELFSQIAYRWADGWRKLSSWDNSFEDQLFDRIWNLFFSQNDHSKGLITKPLSSEQCKSAIRYHYNLP